MRPTDVAVQRPEQTEPGLAPPLSRPCATGPVRGLRASLRPGSRLDPFRKNGDNDRWLKLDERLGRDGADLLLAATTAIARLVFMLVRLVGMPGVAVR